MWMELPYFPGNTNSPTVKFSRCDANFYCTRHLAAFSFKQIIRHPEERNLMASNNCVVFTNL